jgi:hypothetical protein
LHPSRKVSDGGYRISHLLSAAADSRDVRIREGFNVRCDSAARRSERNELVDEDESLDPLVAVDRGTVRIGQQSDDPHLGRPHRDVRGARVSTRHKRTDLVVPGVSLPAEKLPRQNVRRQAA